MKNDVNTNKKTQRKTNATQKRSKQELAKKTPAKKTARRESIEELIKRIQKQISPRKKQPKSVNKASTIEHKSPLAPQKSSPIGHKSSIIAQKSVHGAVKSHILMFKTPPIIKIDCKKELQDILYKKSPLKLGNSQKQSAISPEDEVKLNSKVFNIPENMKKSNILPQDEVVLRSLLKVEPKEPELESEDDVISKSQADAEASKSNIDPADEVVLRSLLHDFPKRLRKSDTEKEFVYKSAIQDLAEKVNKMTLSPKTHAIVQTFLHALPEQFRETTVPDLEINLPHCQEAVKKSVINEKTPNKSVINEKPPNKSVITPEVKSIIPGKAGKSFLPNQGVSCGTNLKSQIELQNPSLAKSDEPPIQKSVQKSLQKSVQKSAQKLVEKSVIKSLPKSVSPSTVIESGNISSQKILTLQEQLQAQEAPPSTIVQQQQFQLEQQQFQQQQQQFKQEQQQLLLQQQQLQQQQKLFQLQQQQFQQQMEKTKNENKKKDQQPTDGTEQNPMSAPKLQQSPSRSRRETVDRREESKSFGKCKKIQKSNEPAAMENEREHIHEAVPRMKNETSERSNRSFAPIKFRRRRSNALEDEKEEKKFDENCDKKTIKSKSKSKRNFSIKSTKQKTLQKPNEPSKSAQRPINKDSSNRTNNDRNNSANSNKDNRVLNFFQSYLGFIFGESSKKKEKSVKSKKIESMFDNELPDYNDPTVKLNVYGLAGINKYLTFTGIGVYHSGVEVYGCEFAFGGYPEPVASIFKMKKPRDLESLSDINGKFTFEQTVIIGRTELKPQDINQLIRQMGEKEWIGTNYHLIYKNCNNFSTEFVRLLTGKPIPEWVNRVASVLIKFPFLVNQIPQEFVMPAALQRKIKREQALKYALSRERDDLRVKSASYKNRLKLQEQAATGTVNTDSFYTAATKAIKALPQKALEDPVMQDLEAEQETVFKVPTPPVEEDQETKMIQLKIPQTPKTQDLHEPKSKKSTKKPETDEEKILYMMTTIKVINKSHNSRRQDVLDNSEAQKELERFFKKEPFNPLTHLKTIEYSLKDHEQTQNQKDRKSNPDKKENSYSHSRYKIRIRKKNRLPMPKDTISRTQPSILKGIFKMVDFAKNILVIPKSIPKLKVKKLNKDEKSLFYRKEVVESSAYCTSSDSQPTSSLAPAGMSIENSTRLSKVVYFSMDKSNDERNPPKEKSQARKSEVGNDKKSESEIVVKIVTSNSCENDRVKNNETVGCKYELSDAVKCYNQQLPMIPQELLNAQKKLNLSSFCKESNTASNSATVFMRPRSKHSLDSKRAKEKQNSDDTNSRTNNNNNSTSESPKKSDNAKKGSDKK